MKKIGKLTINPEKVINNEELVNLKGGVEEEITYIRCACGMGSGAEFFMAPAGPDLNCEIAMQFAIERCQGPCGCFCT